ncbi:hypothetical protein T4B_3886 [Trichinella pseudospiralis]|uniref:Uncharacterized protein n=2 Tax=Trichinella pseudospiralis TaxID=6337 RepID=A0A0V1GTT7_TRIPS|nr:hypothetical protein T4B_4052 [Trichinella pseudospiralis]KRZ01645.1 hypothetical protein T4B_10526 [Trichinella pseudospiralis]KRZ01935.1 hypothetical protein T4B_3886 [Trichinella pseudospiralis]
MDWSHVARLLMKITATPIQLVFNREHYRQERYPLKITDFVPGLNTNICCITSTSTATPIHADPKINVYVPYAFSINRHP